ncbi:MAG: formate dehydrogenase accessory sulfurtransferase FdhD [Deltaproteobacteria bacterium]|jgi:FdhD protein|nr:formate dehydrogenase accessory sulfurtransferase FdhD [Deltaproteobacteria bacterium]MBW2516282.1 formate dehydrogenase accessory sulfurtransferase FdhD [Deltaproteobacteria bacterium]
MNVSHSTHHKIIFWGRGADKTPGQRLVGEEPLSIRLEGKPYSVIMRTPGDETAHAAGFCLGEGIIDTMDDVTSIAFCDGEDTNVIAVTLTPARRKKISTTLDRRSFISQTSCGICGKELVEELYQLIKPVADVPLLDSEKACACLENLTAQQSLRRETKASHAAVLYNARYNLLSVAEDVGRHNALDKAIGKALLDKTLESAVLAILSSRISYELVQKAARARLRAIFALSRPTALAVDLATQLNMTLATLVENEGLYVFCGAQRLDVKSSD